MKKKKFLRLEYGVVALVLLVGLGVGWFAASGVGVRTRVYDSNLPQYSLQELHKFDGSASGTPIFIGMDGYVYDVSLGSKYYGPGGVYHKIAGTDATALLHVFGSSIIREKYPIVGVLSD